MASNSLTGPVAEALGGGTPLECPLGRGVTQEESSTQEHKPKTTHLILSAQSCWEARPRPEGPGQGLWLGSVPVLTEAALG